jgi:hypothetical protein
MSCLVNKTCIYRLINNVIPGKQGGQTYNPTARYSDGPVVRQSGSPTVRWSDKLSTCTFNSYSMKIKYMFFMRNVRLVKLCV